MIRLAIYDDDGNSILEMDDDGSRGTTEAIDEYQRDIEDMIDRLCRMYGVPARYFKDEPHTP